ncbi:MAG: hypothetical protein LBE76_01265 [Nitrososphaerota archaeon]|nr:hypothetical protein [Nitrososphaerota archaeon]
MVSDAEFFRFYDLSTDLGAIDSTNICYYAKHFIKPVKKMLPNMPLI